MHVTYSKEEFIRKKEHSLNYAQSEIQPFVSFVKAQNIVVKTSQKTIAKNLAEEGAFPHTSPSPSVGVSYVETKIDNILTKNEIKHSQRFLVVVEITLFPLKTRNKKPYSSPISICYVALTYNKKSDDQYHVFRSDNNAYRLLVGLLKHRIIKKKDPFRETFLLFFIRVFFQIRSGKTAGSFHGKDYTWVRPLFFGILLFVSFVLLSIAEANLFFA